MEQINDYLSILDKIQGLPAAALVVVVCLAIGWGLKSWGYFPNKAIPVVVMLCGAVIMLSIADPRKTDQLRRIWWGRNLVLGLVFGAIAWGLHYWLLWRVEAWIQKLFPGAPKEEPEKQTDNPQPPRPTEIH